MSILVIAEHDNSELKTATLNTVAAGCKLGEVDLCVLARDVEALANQGAKIKGVNQVLTAQSQAKAELEEVEMEWMALQEKLEQMEQEFNGQ